jgi:hypothetical protein
MELSNFWTTGFPMMSFVGSSLVESMSPVDVALNITITPTPKPPRGFGKGGKEFKRSVPLNFRPKWTLIIKLIENSICCS